LSGCGCESSVDAKKLSPDGEQHSSNWHLKKVMGPFQLHRQFKPIGAASILLLVFFLVVAKPARSQTTDSSNHPSWEKDMAEAQHDILAQRLPAAEEKLSEALQLAKTFPPDDRRRVKTLHQLADVYHSEGKDALAEPLLKEELTINQRTFGPADLHVASSLDALAGVLSSQGKYLESEALYRKALGIKEQVLGPNHPSIVRTLESLAAVEAEAGKYSEAEQLYQEAIQSEIQFFGPLHPGIAVPMDDLAALEMEQAKYDSAETLYEKALKIREQVYGEDHPRVANSLENLAQLYVTEGRYDQAAPLLERALATPKPDFVANGRKKMYIMGLLRSLPNGLMVLASLLAGSSAAISHKEATALAAKKQ